MPQIRGTAGFGNQVLPGILVTASDRTDAQNNIQPVFTDGLGEYLFDVPAGHEIVVTFPTRFQFVATQFLLRGPADIHCQSDQDTDLRLTLYEEAPGIGRITGSVQLEVDQAGGTRPYEGVPVELLDDQQRVLSQTTTDAQGGFLIPTRAHGVLSLRFKQSWGNYALRGAETIGISVRPDAPFALRQQVVYGLDRGRIVGTIMSGNQPLAAVLVETFIYATNLTVRQPTDRQGRYEFLDLSPGRIELRFPSPVVDAAGNVWELMPGYAKQIWDVAPGQIVISARATHHQLDRKRR